MFMLAIATEMRSVTDGYCHHPASIENIVQHITSLGIDQNSKFDNY